GIGASAPASWHGARRAAAGAARPDRSSACLPVAAGRLRRVVTDRRRETWRFIAWGCRTSAPQARPALSPACTRAFTPVFDGRKGRLRPSSTGYGRGGEGASTARHSVSAPSPTLPRKRGRERAVHGARSSLKSSRERSAAAWLSLHASLRLRTRELHHLAPLLGLIDEQLVEVGGAAGQQRGAELGEALLRDRIREDVVGGLVELVDDVRGRTLRHAEPVPGARLVAGQELGDC